MFDGINDHMHMADSPSFKLTQSLTVEGLIKRNSFPSGAPADHGEIPFRGDDRGGPAVAWPTNYSLKRLGSCQPIFFDGLRQYRAKSSRHNPLCRPQKR